MCPVATVSMYHVQYRPCCNDTVQMHVGVMCTYNTQSAWSSTDLQAVGSAGQPACMYCAACPPIMC